MKYKYRLVLDESFSFGTVGRTGRGLTELYNVPVSPQKYQHQNFLNFLKKQASKVDMLLGSIAIGLCSSGGFCAGSRNVIDHQVCAGTNITN